MAKGHKIDEAYVELGVDMEPLNKQLNEAQAKGEAVEKKLNEIPKHSSAVEALNGRLRTGIAQLLDIKAHTDDLLAATTKLGREGGLGNVLAVGQSITQITAMIPQLAPASVLLGTILGTARAVNAALDSGTEKMQALNAHLVILEQTRRNVEGAVAAAQAGVERAIPQIFPEGQPAQPGAFHGAQGAINAAREQIRKQTEQMNTPAFRERVRAQAEQEVDVAAGRPGRGAGDGALGGAVTEAVLQNRIEQRILEIFSEEQRKIDDRLNQLRELQNQLAKAQHERLSTDAAAREAEKIRARIEGGVVREETEAERKDKAIRFKQAVDREALQSSADLQAGTLATRFAGRLPGDYIAAVIRNELVRAGLAGRDTQDVVAVPGLPAEPAATRQPFRSQRFGIAELANRLQDLALDEGAKREQEERQKRIEAQSKSAADLSREIRTIVEDIKKKQAAAKDAVWN